MREPLGPLGPPQAGAPEGEMQQWAKGHLPGPWAPGPDRVVQQDEGSWNKPGGAVEDELYFARTEFQNVHCIVTISNLGDLTGRPKFPNFMLNTRKCKNPDWCPKGQPCLGPNSGSSWDGSCATDFTAPGQRRSPEGMVHAKSPLHKKAHTPKEVSDHPVY